MAKLNGASSLPPAAQTFLESYKALRQEKNEAEASEAIIQLIYQSYYEEMGGAGPGAGSEAARDDGSIERQCDGFQATAATAAEARPADRNSSQSCRLP